MLIRRLRLCAQLAGLWTLAAGVVVLVGWSSGIDRLTRVSPHLPRMAPNTAIWFVLAGPALVLLAAKESVLGWQRRAANVAAIAGLAIGIATILEYAAGVDLGIDQLLFVEEPDVTTAVPGRPSLSSAIAFVLLDTALLGLDRQIGRLALAELLALTCLATALLTFLGCLLGAPPFCAAPIAVRYTGMALITAITIYVLSLGVLLARPRRGLMAIVTSERLGGIVSRRLLLAVMLVPVFNLLESVGVHAGLYSRPTAEALIVVVAVAAMTGIILATGHFLNRLDAERSRLNTAEALERRRLESVLEQMPEAVLIADNNGRVVLQNRAAVALSIGDRGIRDRWGNPVLFDTCTPAGDPAEIDDFPLAKALQGETVTGQEFAVRLADGRLVPILASGAPMRGRSGELLGALAVFRDISPLKDLDRLREEWTAIVAHDLRQPISAISLTAQALSRYHADHLSEQEREAFSRIVAATERLSRMVTDLLDVSRIEARRMQVERREVDLVAFVDSVVTRLAATIPDRRLRFFSRGLPTIGARAPAPLVHIDPDRIEQVLTNLISNAVKYGDRHAEIAVILEWRKEEAAVSVSNWGKGILPDEIPLLFNRYARSRIARESGVPGLGLGLYIAKGLVEAHGGHLSVESTPGRTTTFELTIPYAETSDTPRL
ncbi:MAG: ATP-binding protein [Pseudomonadota bacterium]